MDDTALLDSAIPLFYEHLAELWHTTEQPRAMYARGSAIVPTSTLVHKPWDMDFVLFIETSVERTALMAAVTMAKIRSGTPSLPPPDIRVVRGDSSTPEGLCALLLVANGAKLLFGEDCRLPVIFFSMHSHTIWQYALNISMSRLESFEYCSNPAEKKSRAPHLAKSVLRLGGLLKLQKNCFSRKPEECAAWLCNALPQLEEDISQLLNSLEISIAPYALAKSCRRILSVLAGRF